MTIADAIMAFEQCMPFVGLFVFSLWLRRDLLQAQREVDAFLLRLQQIEAALNNDKRPELFDEKEPEPLPLPRPLPTATARYR
jgi:hypothetical protein